MQLFRNRHSPGRAAFSAGTAAFLLTLQIQLVTTISDNAVIRVVQGFLMVLIIPGLFAAMILGGNVHAFSLIVAAIINALLYFTVILLLCRIICKLLKNNP